MRAFHSDSKTPSIAGRVGSTHSGDSVALGRAQIGSFTDSRGLLSVAQGGSQQFLCSNRNRNRFEAGVRPAPPAANRNRKGQKGLKLSSAEFETMTMSAVGHPRQRTIAPDNRLVEACTQIPADIGVVSRRDVSREKRATECCGVTPEAPTTPKNAAVGPTTIHVDGCISLNTRRFLLTQSMLCCAGCQLHRTVSHVSWSCV